MNFLVDIFSSAGLSSIVGLAGGIIQKFVDLKAKRLEYDHDVRMRNQDIAEAKLEMSHQLSMADKQMDIAEVEGEIQIESKEVDAFVESQKSAGKNSWLTFIRAGITIFILVVCTVITIIIWNKVGGINSFPADELPLLFNSIIKDLFYLLVMCVSWWFAARDGNLRFKK